MSVFAGPLPPVGEIGFRFGAVRRLLLSEERFLERLLGERHGGVFIPCRVRLARPCQVTFRVEPQEPFLVRTFDFACGARGERRIILGAEGVRRCAIPGAAAKSGDNEAQCHNSSTQMHEHKRKQMLV